MRAIEVTIHNFRSIEHQSIRLERLSILAGENNAGKSNIIDAIRLFYGDYKFAPLDAPDFATADDESWIEIEFRPSPDELDQLKDEYRTPEETFRVRNYVLPTELGPDSKKRAGYYAYEDGELSENLFYGAKNVGSGKVGKVIYIPAVSRIDDHTRLTGPSSLRELVSSVLSRVVEGSSAYERLESAFTEFTQAIKTLESTDGKSLQTLEEEISNEIADWDTDFKLGIRTPDTSELVKTLVTHELIDKSLGGEIDQSRFGAGFQRSLVFALINVAARFSPGTRPSGTKKEFTPSLTWILFEEPEVFLHAAQEDILYENLRTVADGHDSQVLLTTHSPRIISSSIDDLTRLVRVRRDEGRTSAKQLTSDQLDNYFRQSDVLDDEIISLPSDGDALDQAKWMNAMKMEVWLQPSRAAAFFARSVLLVEGPSELALCRYLASRGMMPEAAKGLIVVDCLGKYTIHRFMGLFGLFGIDHAVLYDGDGGYSHNEEVESVLAASQSEFTHGLMKFENDLESELGIPKPPKSHQKPQSLLYHLEADLVDPANLERVQEMIASLCESTRERTQMTT